MRKLLGLVLIGLLVWGVAQSPTEAADTARGLGNHASEILTNVGIFVHDLVT